jgi:hypothetical protein
MERLLFLAKIERGIAQANAGKTVPMRRFVDALGCDRGSLDRAGRRQSGSDQGVHWPGFARHSAEVVPMSPRQLRRYRLKPSWSVSGQQ